MMAFSSPIAATELCGDGLTLRRVTGPRWSILTKGQIGTLRIQTRKIAQRITETRRPRLSGGGKPGPTAAFVTEDRDDHSMRARQRRSYPARFFVRFLVLAAFFSTMPTAMIEPS